ncbi:molybdopterin molybdenumtransferase MoeA [Brachybacterium sp. P6-10-X1]|uniref:molybdopterin molybdotransferase MoeA n=1 Tax=Brachybacterium sp. P6-10-X1 TaxID=1903186 RepID=UPI00097177F1|nr:gephyrin-like molybdotransferase Glp [Brachybacterium sp. P6-10-X1]APX34302.1 molybdopterin molybdenumtransferase MoeA [Brachybacterium sp. P6-10-X1]
MTASERIPLADHVVDASALLAPVRRREAVRLDGALTGRVAAVEVRARVDVPGHDNSQMDGYVLASADTSSWGAGGSDGVAMTFPLGSTIAAGDPPDELSAGTARPIMTGAPIPHGADVVIPVEESAAGRFEAEGTGEESPGTVTLTPRSAEAGRFVRRRGSDTHRGDTILRAGQVLTPARLAHLAACGVADVEVEDRLRVIVLSTGSEVAAGGAEPPAGGVFDANGPGLAAALTEAGAQVVHRGTVPDDAGALAAQLREQVLTHDADLIVTSGGVSAGAFEVVRHAASDDGVTMAFPTVAMQPGGPQGIGTLDLPERRVPWLAFPGNPVSALLSCELIARPALGSPPRTRLRLPLRLETPESSPSALEQYRRARVLPSGAVRLVGGASSHLIGGLAAADALVIVPVGIDTIDDGDALDTLLIPGGDR